MDHCPVLLQQLTCACSAPGPKSKELVPFMTLSSPIQGLLAPPLDTGRKGEGPHSCRGGCLLCSHALILFRLVPAFAGAV